MISDERLVVIAAHGRESTFPVTPGDCSAMAKELLELRKATQCNHEWFTLHYGHTEAIYGCKLCGKYKSGQGSY